MRAKAGKSQGLGEKKAGKREFFRNYENDDLFSGV
jgi:hypothetical protein